METLVVHRCECGCGQATRIAKRTDRSQGRVKGRPMRFRLGHSGGRVARPKVKRQRRVIRGEQHGCAKLREAQVLEVRRLYASGLNQRAIARSFGVSKTTIHRILAGRSWAHLEGNQVGLRARPTFSGLLWKSVDRSGGPEVCWLWTGSRLATGYGRIGSGRRLILAHRAAYELLVGPIPPEKPHVLHNCPGGDNPACVNPAHLWVGTNDDNIRDKMAKGRQARGESSGTSILTEAQVLEIRRVHVEEDLGYRRLALRFGVHQQTIANIITGRTWAWLKEAETNVA